MKITIQKPATEFRELSSIAPLTVVKIRSIGRPDRLLVTGDYVDNTISCVDLRSGSIHMVEWTEMAEILESELFIQDSDEGSIQGK